jgi:hypothetical protein
MEFVAFDYLYRYASNDKVRGRVIFANPDGLSMEESANRLRRACLQGGAFITASVQLDDLGSPEIPEDGPWHEFVGVGRMDAKRPSDQRTLQAFIRDFEAAAWAGWGEFIPEDPLPAEVWEAMVAATLASPAPLPEIDPWTGYESSEENPPSAHDTAAWMPFDLF